MPFVKGQKPPNFENTYKPEPLTEAEVRALMRQCSPAAPTGIRDRALIVVLWRCGLRIAEALALKPADVDPRAGTIRVLHGKGDKARVVGMGDGTAAILARWLDTRRQLGLTRRGAIFCTLAGTPLSSGQVRAMLKRRAAKAGIDKRVHPHGLRHSHAVDLVARGVPVNRIQAQLGHDSLAVTDRYLRYIAPADVIAIGRQDTWREDDEPVTP